MKNCIIINNEPEENNYPLQCIQNFFKKEINVTSTNNTLSEGLNAISNQNPDIVIIDSQLKDASGFDILDNITNCNFHLLFTTQNDTFEIKSLDYCGICNIQNPINSEIFQSKINKLLSKNGNYELGTQIDTFHKNIESIDDIAIELDNGIISIPVDDIIFFESNKEHTKFMLDNGEYIVSPNPFLTFDKTLSDRQFFKISDTHVVNTMKIKSYRHGTNASVEMKDGTEIKIDRNQRDDFRERIMFL